ncbi:hypothetical protein Tco_0983036 [Tanacetum coccineum]
MQSKSSDPSRAQYMHNSTPLPCVGPIPPNMGYIYFQSTLGPSQYSQLAQPQQAHVAQTSPFVPTHVSATQSQIQAPYVFGNPQAPFTGSPAQKPAPNMSGSPQVQLAGPMVVPGSFAYIVPPKGLMGEPLSPDRVFDFPMDELKPHPAYDFFASGQLPGYAGNQNNNNGWIEADVPLLGEPGAVADELMVGPLVDEIAEPIVEAEENVIAPVIDMEEDIAMLFDDGDFSDDDYEGLEDEEEV